MKPISQTAFYCCGTRAQDAEASHPVCGDRYAKLFMNEEGLRIFEAFKNETYKNAGMVARHRIIDDFLRQELSADPDLPVILIGAGFDSRAYRLEGGKWLELDEPQIISYKNECLSVADCKNELQRIPVDFSADSIEEKLLPFSKASSPVVVIEGVFIYLDEESIRQLLQTLHRLFPGHKLICDLVSRKFFKKYGRALHKKIQGMGVSFVPMDNPDDIFFNNGYCLKEKVSVVSRAVEWGPNRIPMIFFKLFFQTLLREYSVNLFEPDGG